MADPTVTTPAVHANDEERERESEAVPVAAEKKKKSNWADSDSDDEDGDDEPVDDASATSSLTHATGTATPVSGGAGAGGMKMSKQRVQRKQRKQWPVWRCGYDAYPDVFAHGCTKKDCKKGVHRGDAGWEKAAVPNEWFKDYLKRRVAESEARAAREVKIAADKAEIAALIEKAKVKKPKVKKPAPATKPVPAAAASSPVRKHIGSGGGNGGGSGPVVATKPELSEAEKARRAAQSEKDKTCCAKACEAKVSKNTNNMSLVLAAAGVLVVLAAIMFAGKGLA
jgi:hypothetical protein